MPHDGSLLQGAVVFLCAAVLAVPLAKRLQLGSSQLELAGVWQQRLDSGTLAWREVLYNGQQIQRESRNDQRHRVYFTAELEF